MGQLLAGAFFFLVWIGIGMIVFGALGAVYGVSLFLGLVCSIPAIGFWAFTGYELAKDVLAW